MPVPLKTTLQNGQAIEVIRGQNPSPNPNWLDFVVTAKARSQIRHFLKTQHSGDAIQLGGRLLKKALKGFGVTNEHSISEAQQQHLLAELKVQSWDELLMSIGLGNRLPSLVAKQVLDGIHEMKEQQHAPVALHISGAEGLAIHYAHCCYPVPGDCIMGFISNERGLVIHRTDCPNLTNFRKHPEKWIDVKWEENISAEFSSAIVVETDNRRGVLATIANAIAIEGANIEGVRTEDKDNHHSVIFFTIAVKDGTHLASVLKRLRGMNDVFRADRLQ
jgi:GTP pyrophosphokinase